LLIRAKYLVDVVGYNQVNGMPLKAAELAEAITDLIAHTAGPVPTPDSTTDTTGEMEAVK
jgi:2-oxoglutarate ferredoxin oxidoreductase subunit alpha